MKTAGANSLGFFIEPAEYFILFFLFLNCYVCAERRNILGKLEIKNIFYKYVKKRNSNN